MSTNEAIVAMVVGFFALALLLLLGDRPPRER